MQWWRLRPTFEIPICESRELAIDKLSATVKQLADPEHVRMHGEYGEIHLPLSEHRLWSPHLSFFISCNESGCNLHGRFAPRWGVWTAVWAFYLAMSFSAFYGFTLAYSQWQLNQYAWGMWVALAALLAIAVLYVVAHIGQQLSIDQMHQLREQLEKAVQESGIEIDHPPAGTRQVQAAH